MNATAEEEKVAFQTRAPGGPGNRRSTGTLVLVNKPTTEHLNALNQWETTKGSSIEFEGGVFETSDPDEIEFLRDHKNNGRLFHEVREAPSAEDEAAVLREIAQAQADADGDKLAEIYAREMQSHSRSSILAASEAALEIVEGRRPDAVPVPEHQLHRERVGAVRPPTPGDSPADERIGGEAYSTSDSGGAPPDEGGATVPAEAKPKGKPKAKGKS